MQIQHTRRQLIAASREPPAAMPIQINARTFIIPRSSPGTEDPAKQIERIKQKLNQK